MNRKSTTIVRSPILNDFIYTILFNASYQQKRGLLGKYMKAAMNQRSAKKFVAHSTRDEKEYIMSHFGFEFYYVVARRGTTYESMKAILEKFDNNKTFPAMSDIAKEGLFVMGNTEFLRMLGLMSKTIHHPTYFMNLEFQKQGYNIQHWGKRVNIDEDLQARETDEFSRMFAQTCINASLAIDSAASSLGVNKTTIKILLYLYYTKAVELSKDQLYAYFSGNMKKTEFNYGMKELIGGQLVTAFKKDRVSISGEGMRSVNNYLGLVNKMNMIC